MTTESEISILAAFHRLEKMLMYAQYTGFFSRLAPCQNGNFRFLAKKISILAAFHRLEKMLRVASGICLGSLFISLALTSTALCQSPLPVDNTHSDTEEQKTIDERPAVEITATVDKAVIKSDESLRLTITIKNRPEITALNIPEFGSSIQGFRIENFGSTPAENAEGFVQSSRWYELKADISGSYIIPSFAVAYLENEENKSIKTSEIFVEVKAPAAPSEEEGTEDIRDIKDIVPTPIDQLFWWGVGLGILFLGVVAVLVTWLIRKGRAKSKAQPLIPAHEIALKRMNELKESKWRERALEKRFHFELSDIIRAYLEGRYGLPATDRTTEEIQREIIALKGLDKDRKQQFIELIQQMDVVKFTDTLPGWEYGNSLLTGAEEFVLTTSPRPEVNPEQESVL